MKTITYETSPGDNFTQVAENAKTLTNKETIVSFEFNGVTCVVSENTNLDLLCRDYSNSWTMEWGTVGPDCHTEYPPDVQAEYDRRKAKKDEERAKADEDARKKDEAEQNAFKAKTDGISIALKDEKEWENWRSKNTEGYGNAIFEFAEGWAKLMQVEHFSGKSINQCAEPTSFQLGFLGITGFQYGAAVQVLTKCWLYGEELRVWHNRKYNHNGDGVVNPAILTVKP